MEVLDIKLFTVGPVACYPQVLEEMKRQMFSHRSEEYKALHRDTVEKLKEFLDTENSVFLFSSTGSGFMEASVRNCVTKKILCCVNGSFGKRFADIALANGKVVETLAIAEGEPILPDLLDEKLARCPDVEAVSIIHNETSTGLINPLEKLARIVKKYGVLLLVDTVSSMGGTDIKVDQWGLDVCFTSSQKCFGIPPGLAIGSVSAAALKKSESAQNKGWYFDFKLWERYNTRAGTPMTPAIPQIVGLNRILELIENWGGRAKYFELYSKRNGKIKTGVKELGFTLFPREGYESPTVNCVNAVGGISGSEIYEGMRRKGFELARGYGGLGERTFRIGNMGYIEFEDIELMLKALEETLVSSSK